jgi:hypothetical protein
LDVESKENEEKRCTSESPDYSLLYGILGKRYLPVDTMLTRKTEWETLLVRSSTSSVAMMTHSLEKNSGLKHWEFRLGVSEMSIYAFGEIFDGV